MGKKILHKVYWNLAYNMHSQKQDGIVHAWYEYYDVSGSKNYSTQILIETGKY